MKTSWPIALAALALAAAAGYLVAGLGSGEEEGSAPPAKLAFGESDYGADSAVVWAVGDGADGRQAGIDLGRSIPASIDRFLYLGDVYEGTGGEYAREYNPAYGHLDAVTSPTAGNHEWELREQGYYPYWASEAGGVPPSYYSFKLAGWEILSLNTEVPVDRGSEQLRWLRSQVTEPGTCRLAYWHTPRYTAGFHDDDPAIEPLWATLTGHASVVLSGHDHNTQILKPVEGLVQMIAGAGGHEIYNVDETDPRLEYANDQEPTALRLDLEPGVARIGVFNDEGEELHEDEITCDPLPPGPSS